MNSVKPFLVALTALIALILGIISVSYIAKTESRLAQLDEKIQASGKTSSQQEIEIKQLKEEAVGLKSKIERVSTEFQSKLDELAGKIEQPKPSKIKHRKPAKKHKWCKCPKKK